MQQQSLNLLIVEDEFMAFEYLSDILNTIDTFKIFHATCSDEALDIVKNNPIDICFMDINIVGSIDGISCAKVINKEYFLPIIYATAHADSQTITEVKDTNVYGYLVKPFNIKEVEATLNVTIKVVNMFHMQKMENDKKIEKSLTVLSDSYSYNKDTKTFFVDNLPLKLTNKEIGLIDFLCKHINQNISYDIIKQAVWGTTEISLSTLRDTVYRIKQKAPNLEIENISNYGYILKAH